MLLFVLIAALILSPAQSEPITPENVTRLEVINRLNNGGKRAQAIAFNPLDSQQLALAQTDGVVSIWDVVTGEVRLSWQAADPDVDLIALKAIAYMPDGNRLITASPDGNIKAWTSDTGDLLKTMTVPDEIPLVLDTAQNDMVAVGYEDGTVRLWNVDTGEITLSLYGYNGWVIAVDISLDGKRVAFGYPFGNIVIYRLDDIEKQHIYIEQILMDAGELNNLAFVPSPQPREFVGEYGLATISNFRSLQFWDAQYKMMISHWSTESTMAYPYSLNFNQDSSLVAVGGKSTTAGGWCEANPCPIEIIRVRHNPNDVQGIRPILASLEETGTGPTDEAFSNDDRFFAASFENGAVLIWGIPEP